MVTLNPQEQAKLLAFVNKATQKLAEYADEVKTEKSFAKSRKTIQRALELGRFLNDLNDPFNTWSNLFIMKQVDRLINLNDLYEILINPSQLQYADLITRIIGDGITIGGGGGGGVTQAQLDAEAIARQNADNVLQQNINTTNTRIDNLDFIAELPPEVVFSVPTTGFADFPSLISQVFANKAVLDQLTAQDLDTLDAAVDHINDADIHVTPQNKADWDAKIGQATLDAALALKANLSHTHDIPEVNGLQDALDALEQAIVDALGETPETPIISVGTVTTGSPTSVTIDPTSTSTNVIFNFVIEQGPQGEPGEDGLDFSYDAVDFLVNRSNYSNEDIGFTFVDVETGLVYYKLSGPGNDTWSNPVGTRGDTGWTPVILPEIISDTRVVYKLVDYIGGQGIKPTENIDRYLAETGFVADQTLAVNFKGQDGTTPIAGVDYEIPRFKIDLTLPYEDYLTYSANNINTEELGFTIYIEGSEAQYSDKDGKITILDLNPTTQNREWTEYQFKGEDGAGVDLVDGNGTIINGNAVDLGGNATSNNFSINTDSLDAVKTGLTIVKNGTDEASVFGNPLGSLSLIHDVTGTATPVGEPGLFIVGAEDGVRYSSEPVNVLPGTVISKRHADATYVPRLLVDKVISTTTYTILETDLNKNLIFTVGCTITLPNGFPKGFNIQVRKDTIADLVFVAEGTLNSVGGNTFSGEAGNHAFLYTDNSTTWVGILPNTGGTGSGDMLASVYDPQAIAQDAFDRVNHTGSQAISTITNLQTTLDSKLEADDFGTAAFKNTGISGDTIPLLNQDATFSSTVKVNKLSLGAVGITISSLSDDYPVNGSVLSINTGASTEDVLINSVNPNTGSVFNQNTILLIENGLTSTQNVVIKHLGTGTNSFKFRFGNESDLILEPGENALFKFVGGNNNGWNLISKSQVTAYTDQQVQDLVPTQLPSFSSVIDLSINSTFRHQVGGAIEFTLGTDPAPVLGKKAIFYLIADGLNRPTFGAGFVEKFDNYDNTQNRVNRCYFEYVGNNTVLYEITYV